MSARLAVIGPMSAKLAVDMSAKLAVGVSANLAVDTSILFNLTLKNTG